MSKIKEDKTCPHCKQGKVEYISGYHAWSSDNWICPKCDSTYPEWKFKKDD